VNIEKIVKNFSKEKVLLSEGAKSFSKLNERGKSSLIKGMNLP
jgi:hypothetical protein